jgi:hypothetical protein
MQNNVRRIKKCIMEGSDSKNDVEGENLWFDNSILMSIEAQQVN